MRPIARGVASDSRRLSKLKADGGSVGASGGTGAGGSGDLIGVSRAPRLSAPEDDSTAPRGKNAFASTLVLMRFAFFNTDSMAADVLVIVNSPSPGMLIVTFGFAESNSSGASAHAFVNSLTKSFLIASAVRLPSVAATRLTSACALASAAAGVVGAVGSLGTALAKSG